MRSVLLIVFVIGSFKFSEGKSCPQASRPHLTRCDMYFRCMMLPSKTHVWVPTQCERGLVYEPNLRLCVLPGDDWECNLGEHTKSDSDDANRYGINTLNSYPTEMQQNVLNVKSDEVSDINNMPVNIRRNDNETESEFTSDPDETFESSGDGGFQDSTADPTIEFKIKSSDDDVENMKVSKIDPKLTTQLQRLSQLIDGLRKTYEGEKSSIGEELRPDQLNSFLAHYDIKSKFDGSSVEPLNFNKFNIPENGKIHPAILNYILSQQKRLPQKSSPVKPNSTMVLANKQMLQVHVPQRPDPPMTYDPGEDSNSINLNNRYRNPQLGGYSNSQILVNRPEGSVIFGVPSNTEIKAQNYKDVPNISEETLKTVLELSKQMISNQPIRQVFPSSNLVHPFIQPYYYPILSQGQFVDTNGFVNNYEKISSQTYTTSRPYEKTPSTIIKNNVIPITITRPSGTGNDQMQKYDSYGNKVNSDHILYPPYSGSVGKRPVQETNIRRPVRYDENTGQYDQESFQSNYNTNNFWPVDQRYPILTSDKEKLPQQLSDASYGNYHHKKTQNYQVASGKPNVLFPEPLSPFSVKIRPNSYQSEDNSAEDEVLYEANQDQQQHQNHVNNQIVTDLLSLPSNLDHSMTLTDANTASNLQHNQLVEIGGSFINYDIYKNQLLPSLGDSLINKFHVITCTAGIRQPNSTDCTKYYVCNPKTGDVTSYSCPPYTAFNSETHICDAKTFAFCSPEAIQNRFTILENKKMQLEALQSLQNAKRMRDEALRAQTIANLLRLETQNAINSSIGLTNSQAYRKPITLSNYETMEHDNSSPIQDAPFKGTTIRPGHRNRIKYRCKDGAKIPDRKSTSNYYVCFKDKNGVLKGQRMSCSSGLIFCPKTLLCTLPRRCT